MRAVAIALVVSALLAGCAGAPDRGPDEGPVKGEPVAFRTVLHQGSIPIVPVSIASEIDEGSWNHTWDAYAANLTPRPPKPFIDFGRERAIAVSTGQHGSGCADVQVTDVVRQEARLVVSYAVFDGESPTTVCSGQVVWPTHVIAIADPTENLHFLGRAVRPPEPWTRPDPPLAPTTLLAPRMLENGSFSGIHRDTRLALSEGAAWEALWREHREAEPVPEVDFTKEQVVAVVVHGPTGCAGIHLRQLIHHPDVKVVTVEIVHEIAPPTVNCFAAFEDVYVFVAIPRLDAEVRFIDLEGA